VVEAGAVVDMEMAPEVWVATQSLVPVAVAGVEARVLAVLQGQEEPGVPMTQAGVVVRQAHKPERQELLALLVHMDVEMVAAVEVGIQVPVLEGEEAMEVIQAVEVEAEELLILAPEVRLVQEQGEKYEYIHGRR